MEDGEDKLLKDWHVLLDLLLHLGVGFSLNRKERDQKLTKTGVQVAQFHWKEFVKGEFLFSGVTREHSSYYCNLEIDTKF